MGTKTGRDKAPVKKFLRKKDNPKANLKQHQKKQAHGTGTGHHMFSKDRKQAKYLKKATEIEMSMLTTPIQATGSKKVTRAASMRTRSGQLYQRKDRGLYL